MVDTTVYGRSELPMHRNFITVSYIFVLNLTNFQKFSVVTNSTLDAKNDSKSNVTALLLNTYVAVKVGDGFCIIGMEHVVQCMSLLRIVVKCVLVIRSELRIKDAWIADQRRMRAGNEGGFRC